MTQTQQDMTGSDLSNDFVTFWIAEQLFGIHVLKVQDILAQSKTTPVPLAPPEIAGSLNLRGRIVTSVDVRCRLGLPPDTSEGGGTSIVVEQDHDLYSLLVDSVGEVLTLAADSFEPNPPTLSPAIRQYATGIYRLEKELLVVLDVDRLLDYGRSAAA